VGRFISSLVRADSMQLRSTLVDRFWHRDQKYTFVRASELLLVAEQIFMYMHIHFSIPNRIIIALTSDGR